MYFCLFVNTDKKEGVGGGSEGDLIFLQKWWNEKKRRSVTFTLLLLQKKKTKSPNAVLSVRGAELIYEACLLYCYVYGGVGDGWRRRGVVEEKRQTKKNIVSWDEEGCKFLFK